MTKAQVAPPVSTKAFTFSAKLWPVRLAMLVPVMVPVATLVAPIYMLMVRLSGTAGVVIEPVVTDCNIVPATITFADIVLLPVVAVPIRLVSVPVLFGPVPVAFT